MTTYNGATFYVLVDGSGGFRPDWEKELALTITHIPGSDEDDIQSGGLANGKVTVPVLIESDAGYALLQAAVGITKRTLASFGGANYTNVILTAIRKPRRLPGGDGTWLCDLEFVQVSS
jgi:hypothetical protein